MIIDNLLSAMRLKVDINTFYLERNYFTITVVL